MRRAPDAREFARYPVVSTTVILATAVTVARLAGRDVRFLEMDPHVGRGEAWRFVTSALPHVNVLHLVFNVYWTWVFGTLVESVFGAWRTAAIFVLFAVVSGGAEYAILEGGIGLSGVGYGLFGLLWVLGRRDLRFAGAVDCRTIGLFVVWFFVCIVTTVTGSMAVANVAHGTGALVGAALGFAIARRAGRRAVAAGLTALLAAASLAGATVARPYVNRSPERGRPEVRFGCDALVAHRNEDALRWFTEATRLDAGNAIAWYDLGITQQRLGRRREAAVAYEKAYRLEPNDADMKQAYERTR